MFEAVNSIVGGFEPYVRRIHAPPQSLPEAAVIAAAHRALTSLHPQSAADLDALRTDALAGLGDRPGKADGVAVGVQAADAILALRSDDGFDVEVPYTPGIEPGDWQPTPPRFAPAFAAGLGRMAAFGIPNVRPCRAERQAYPPQKSAKGTELRGESDAVCGRRNVIG